MHIDSYSLGEMVVDGKRYASDLILLPGKVLPDWWRARGHTLVPGDLKELSGCAVQFLVIGTGRYGRMEVPDDTVRYLKEKGIDPVVQQTHEACKTYNEKAGVEGVAGAFHLTC